MKFNQWTLALASAGMVSLGSIAQADDAAHSVLSHVSKTTLSGYVDTSAIWALGEGGNGNLPGRNNDGAGYVDGFNLNVVQLTLEKPLDDSEWSSGYRVDMWMGPDSQWLGNYSIGGGGGGDFSLKQAYVNVNAPIGNGLDIKMGVFDTIIGYEVANSPGNANFGRSYGFFFEPFQHTGVLASYQLTDELGFTGGVANTFNAGINDRPFRPGGLAGGAGSESQKTYLAALTYDVPEDAGVFGGASLTVGVVDGLSTGPEEQTNFYAGASTGTPVDGLTLGIAFDYAENAAQAGPIGIDAWALAGYFSYTLTEKATLHGRIDYLQADDFFFADLGTPGAQDEDNELLALTATLDYSLWENVLSRLEVRWDHSLEGDLFGGPSGTFFGAADDDSVVTIALNAVYQF